MIAKTVSESIRLLNMAQEERKVSLEVMSLNEVFKLKLKIPPYQRIYCWKEKTVTQLLKDLSQIEQTPYCIGNIILQKKQDGDYDIIDGQQRLVTLTLFADIMGLKYNLDLLDQKIESSEAQDYIANNKYVIEQFCKRHSNDYKNKDVLLEKVLLNVLILEDGSLDLAYTFFSNENSRGAALTDYDLLKAHHLRFVPIEKQQEHLARRWEKMLSLPIPQDSDRKEYEQTLETYLFRLRKWLNSESWDESERHRIKKEFEQAAMIEAIPPFCESFNYIEPIQGGTHFFEYVDHFIEELQHFKTNREYEYIHRLKSETHVWLRDAIEALLFAYYLKFGNRYLTEALLLITRHVSQVRYENKRIHLCTILEHVMDSGIPLRIEHFTSPTFFLAFMLNEVNQMQSLKYIKETEGSTGRGSDIRERYNNCLSDCFSYINEDELVIPNINYWHK